MEIVFLLAGLAFIGVGILIIVSEIRSRQGTAPIPAKVIGFSTGKSDRSKVSSFHTVAEYLAGGRKYYVEGSVGSSVPLHAVGDAITVLVSAREPEKAVLESRLSFILGGALTLMGLGSAAVFAFTFRPNLFSMGMAAFVLFGLVLKVRRAWRKQPLSVEAWQAYKEKVFSTRVFTDETRDQIAWADPARIAVAVEAYRKTNRFAVPALLILGAGLLLLSYHLYWKMETFLRAADRASGHVVSLKERSSDDGNSTYSAVVEYTDAGGRSFMFTDSFSSSPPTYYTGDVVNVLYNRDHQSEAQIDRGVLNHWASAACGIPGSLFLLLGLRSARKKSRAGKSG